MGADGVNPIEFMILVGDGNRQWLEPHYFNSELKPLGRLRTIIPAAPDEPDALLDACIAFYPKAFDGCPSLSQVRSELGTLEVLDFDAAKASIPASWTALREEARPRFRELYGWRADLMPLEAGI